MVTSVLSVSCSSKKETPPATVNPKTDKLKLADGFAAEHLYSPSENNQGSWVAMAFDHKGRMITSDQYGSLYRFELPSIGDTSVLKIEKLDIGFNDTTGGKTGIGYAQGLVYAFNSLYVLVNHGGDEKMEKSSGLYRLQDTDGNDQFDKITLLKSLQGEGEHGPHSIKLSPDKKSLYVVVGNHTDLPPMDAYRQPPVWKEDNLFPLIKDPRGHATDRLAPGGWIAKLDSSGTTWELISSGYRNTFDITFNDAGDLFAYDSDMEWDFGMPWYRPTRICHVTSGSEYGWRTGNSKWSPDYPDNLPPVINIGQGSPTNFTNGQGSRFPAKYQKALFASDWSFGIIYAIHLTPKGASYTAKAEEFLSGAPLPLTDGMVGPDGAFYFLTGGRRLESDLYRVYYTKETEPASSINNEKLPAEAALRIKLEQYHKPSVPGVLEEIWLNLAHEDRFVRYAARIALEHQPLTLWQGKTFKEKNPVTLTQAAIALARLGNSKIGNPLLTSLNTIDFEKLNVNQQADLLRAYELVFARLGAPEGVTRTETVNYLESRYPATSNAINRSLSKILVFLESPLAVEKTMALLENAKDDPADKTVTESSDLIMRNPQYGLDIASMLSKIPPAQQTYLATVLGEADQGWTPELRERYFKWFSQAFTYKGGRSYLGFIDKARQMALSRVSKNEREHFNTISGGALLTTSGNDLADLPSPEGPGRNWSLEEATLVIDSGLVGRDFENGRSMFAATLCRTCHVMQGEGGIVGPDLTNLGTRFSSRDMLVHILQPDKEISDQYAATVFSLKDGSSVVGRLTNENETTYYVSQNPFAPSVIREITKSEVLEKKPSRVSLMVPGLINRLNPEELKDLVAFLISGGKKDHEVYKPSQSVNP